MYKDGVYRAYYNAGLDSDYGVDTIYYTSKFSVCEHRKLSFLEYKDVSHNVASPRKKGAFQFYDLENQIVYFCETNLYVEVKNGHIYDMFTNIELSMDPSKRFHLIQLKELSSFNPYQLFLIDSEMQTVLKYKNYYRSSLLKLMETVKTCDDPLAGREEARNAEVNKIVNNVKKKL